MSIGKRNDPPTGQTAPRRYSSQLLLYLPVLHVGYEKLLDRHRDAAEILVLGASFGEQFRVLRKEIRALSPHRAAQYLRGVGYCGVKVVEAVDLPEAVNAAELVVPDEDVLRELVAAYRLDERATVRFERTFLRWDREWSRVGRPARPDVTATTDDLARTFMGVAVDASSRSSDWWRQVGAVAVRAGGVMFVAHNRHLPTEYSPYLDGDPRNSFSRGQYVELSTAIHAEAALVAEAARTGVALAGADLYVSTFPCPGCARLVAASGFRRCFYAGPYSMLDGDEVLRQAGIELIWVDLETSSPMPGG